MGEGGLERRCDTKTATILNGAALSEALDVRVYAGGTISFPAGWTAATLGFKHCSSVGGTYQPLLKKDGVTRVEMTVTTGSDAALPDEIFGCSFIKLWSENGSGVDTNQATADRVFSLSLKG